MTNTKKFGHIAVIFLLIVISASVNAQTYNETIRALDQSRTDLKDMTEAGFSVLRINDTLEQAEQLFEAQSALLKAGGTPDFSLILERTNEVSELREQAEAMNDEINALEARLEGIGESEAHSLLDKAKQEFADERYNKISDLVEEAYTRISEEKALQTRFRAIYEAGKKTVFDFFKERWEEITITIASIILIYLVLHKRVSIFLINRKIKNLSFEKGVLGSLIKKSQYEYFHLQSIPEELYHIRIEKFGELIRDIDRQVPVLMEERERLKGRVKDDTADDTARKRTKKFYKGLTIIIMAVYVIIGIMFLLVYFKIISYNQITGFMRKTVTKIAEGLNFAAKMFGINALILELIFFLIFISAVLAFIYLYRKKGKKTEPGVVKAEEVREPEEQVKKPGIYYYLQEHLSAKINRFKTFIKNLMEKIVEAREYKRLIKQKGKEEKPRIRYLRKQKWRLFKRNLQQKIHSLIYSLRQSEKKELDEHVKTLEKIKRKHEESLKRREKRKKEIESMKR